MTTPMISPLLARVLLWGVTEGRWEWKPDGSGAVSLFTPLGLPIATGIAEKDAPLIAKAPEMAETIAGMREVWAVQVYANYDRFRGWKYITVEDILIDSPNCAWWHSERHVAESEAERMDDPTRIVRRLVTEPEVIE